MKSLARAATAVGVLALGFAGFAATASAAPATSFEVCSPLGCAAQSVRGLVDRGQLVVTVSDSSPVSALTARFAVSPQGGMTQVIVDDGVRRASIRLPNGSAQLIVTACGGGGCNSKSIPL